MTLKHDERENPKLAEHPGSNTEKDPKDWVSGDEQMTGAQASYLKTLCEQTNAEFTPDQTQAEASLEIDALRADAGVAKG